MATATATPTAPFAQSQAAITAEALAGTDVTKRGIKRVLPCKLTEAEFMLIAKQRVDKEALYDQVVEDFDKLKAKHKAQIEEMDGEIGKMRRELHSGEQDRTVLCVEVFRRGADGGGWIHTLRMDTLATVFAAARADGMSHGEASELALERARVEMRPATPTEAQRHLPDLDGAAVDRNAPLLDQATAAQGGAHAVGDDAESDGVPDGAEPGDEDDGLGDDEPDEDADGDAEPAADETPAQRSARESQEGRAARRAGKGKRGGKGGK